ncbi:tyrosine-protein phosphatase non-receptor type 18 [Ctenodactylus gundi]
MGVCSTTVGSWPKTVTKNCYKDVVPYDQTQVILSLLQEKGRGNYLNGSFMRGTDGSQAYITTHTLLDFWQLVWEFGVKVKDMVFEKPRNWFRTECERYWPQEQDPLQTGLFYITLLGILCTVDYVRRLLLTQTIPPSFSLFDVVLEMWKQRPVVVHTGEQYTFLYHIVAQVFHSALQRTSPQYQNLKENPVSRYDDALSLWIPTGVLVLLCPPVPTLTMADTYAVVQKRKPPAGTGQGAREHSTVQKPLYSQIVPGAQRPKAHTEDVQEALPGCFSADQSSDGPDAYEDVADTAQTAGLGFNLRIGKPKGPRDPPAEWTRV